MHEATEKLIESIKNALCCINSLLIIGYNMAMVCRGPVLAHLRQYCPEGFSPRANASEGVPIRARGIP